MTITFDVSPEMEERARNEAARLGQDTQTYLHDLLNTTLIERLRRMEPRTLEITPGELLKLPHDERAKILEQQAEFAAAIYEADLALPVEQRELTAFTALDGEPVLENHHLGD